MPTKLSRYAEGILEASWLAALFLVPVFFNVYSKRIFEPDKITLLRTLALVILAAWAVKLIEQGKAGWIKNSLEGGWGKFILHFPLIGPVLALAAITILSTLFSISLNTSFWGSYPRLQGAYTTLSYLVIFSALATHLRSRSQFARLISVAILSSVPVCIYGVLQHYNLDPLPWAANTASRVEANLGNPIFVAAYLIMVLPLTLMRMVESVEAWVHHQARWANITRSLICTFILVLQTMTIYFSGSRGPWLGLAASLVVLWVGVSLVWRKRWMAIVGVSLTLLSGIFLVGLNLQIGPFQSLREQAGWSRLAELLDSNSRTGKIRTLIWQGASELVRPHAPLDYPDGHQDMLNWIRPLVGYGPESIYVAYHRFYQIQTVLYERRDKIIDRAHNEIWDTLVTTGGLGLIAYLLLYGSIFFYGLVWMGWAPGKKDRYLLGGLVIGCGLLATSSFVAWRGIKFIGVGLPFGMVLGVILYLYLLSISRRNRAEDLSIDRSRAYLLLGLFAAILAHFLETTFGVAIAATRLYFWTDVGLLVVVGANYPRQAEAEAEAAELGEQEKSRSNGRKRIISSSSIRRKSTVRGSAGDSVIFGSSSWKRQGVILGLIVGLFLTTLGFSFLSYTSYNTTALGWILASFNQQGHVGTRNGIIFLFVTTWFSGIILLASESRQLVATSKRNKDHSWLKMVGLGAGISAGIAVLFWMWNAAGLAALGRAPANSIEDILAQLHQAEGVLTTFYIQLLAFVFGLAVVLPQKSPALLSRLRFLGVALACILGGAALVGSIMTNGRVIQADIAFRTGELIAQQGDLPAAIAIYERASRLAPKEDSYYLKSGSAILDYTKTIRDTAAREQYILRAEEDFRQAQEISPLNPNHTASLARLYSFWATITTDPALRQSRAMISDQYYVTALNLSPKNVELMNERSILFLKILKQPERSYEILQQSMIIDPSYDWTDALMGNYFAENLALQYSDQPEKQQAALEKAAQHYQNALTKGSVTASKNSLSAYAQALGEVETQLGKIDRAIQSYQTALEYQPDSTENWRIWLEIARLYAQQREYPHAQDYARKALNQAPDDQKETIRDLLNQLDQ